MTALQLPAEPQGHLDSVARELDEAYRGVAARLPTNEPVTMRTATCMWASWPPKANLPPWSSCEAWLTP